MHPVPSFDLTAFAEAKASVLTHLEEIKTVAQALKQAELASALEEAQAGLEDNRFKVVVVGEFSRGKSTLINALLGARVLPSSPQPSTAILNVINHADAPRYRMLFRHGDAPRQISAEEFTALVAPTEPIPGDAASESAYAERTAYLAQVDHADIGYPTPFCREGVELIDTPGTNDLDPAREAITYGFIPQSDAAIFLLAANQALAHSEMQFLKERILAADVQRIFFLVNFRDKLKLPGAEEKALSFIRRHLEAVMPDPRIFLVSARNALNIRRAARGETLSGPVPTDFAATGFPEFEAALANFLTEERGRAKFGKPAARGIRLAQEVNELLAARRGMLGQDVQQLAKKLADVQPDLARASAERDRALSALRTSLENGRLELRSQLKRGLEEIARVAVSAVDHYQGDLEQKALAAAVESAVAGPQSRLHERMCDLQQQLLEEEVSRAIRRLDDAWNLVTTALGNELQALTRAGTVNVTAGTGGDIAFQTGLGVAAIGLAASALHFALPITLPLMLVGGGFLYSALKDMARQRVLGQVREKVNARYSDVIPGMLASFDQHWANLTGRIVDELSRDMSRRISALQETIGDLIAQRQRVAAADQAEGERLTALQAQLARATAALSQLETTNG